MSGDDHRHTGEARRLVDLCARGSEQARQVLRGPALARIARNVGDSVKRNRGEAQS